MTWRIVLTEKILDEELQTPTSSLYRTLGVVLFIGIIACVMIVSIHGVQASDPYIQEVLSLQGNQDRGQEIFQMNCAVCHGIEGAGEVGPSLLGVSARKSKANLIKQVVSGKTPPMPQFQPDTQEMADLLRYLETL